MRNTYKSIILIAVAITMAVFYTSCKKDSDGGGTPYIKYIRVTDPLKSDSLLVGAAQGNVISIIGENLQDARQIWFNDQRAFLSPTYITSSTIIVSVPTKIPTDITNKLSIVFANGDTLRHDFHVEISKPSITGMLCEYVPVGSTATIQGDYFYPPLTVTFPGGINGEIVTVEDKAIKVIVPQGVQPGQITVTTNFGKAKSNFWFDDTRNIVISSDPYTGWWNQSFVVTSPGPEDPVKINGNYIRVKKSIGAWDWIEVAGGPASAMGPISKNIPDEAILKPELYYLKFEVNTVKPYTSNTFRINVGLQSEVNNAYFWQPPYDTKGNWQTVVIPFEDVIASYKALGAEIKVNPDGYWTRLLFQGGSALDCDMCFDNFRVVPKVLR